MPQASWQLPSGCHCSSSISATPRSSQLQVAASLLSAAMRSRLLLSVARLPTIRESWEEMLPVGPGQESLVSPSLDDYMRSICQQAQPTSELNEATARTQSSRPHWPAQACKKSCPTGSLQDTTARFSSQHPALLGASTADPLDWLFGQSQERQQRWRDLPRRTGSSAEPWGPHRQTDGRGKLCDPRAPGHFRVRPLRDWNQGSQTSWQPIRAAASPPSSRPSSVLRALYLHLPVIHEL